MCKYTRSICSCTVKKTKHAQTQARTHARIYIVNEIVYLFLNTDPMNSLYTRP